MKSLGKRMLALVMAAALVMGLCVTGAGAETAGLWTDQGVRADSFSVTDTNSITIMSAAELGLLAHNINSGTTYNGYTITIGADLDLSGHYWYPIDARGKLVNAIIDGGGHTIRNMHVIDTIYSGNYSGYYAAFIGYTNKTLTIKDLCFDSAIIAPSRNPSGNTFGPAGASCCAVLVGRSDEALALENVTVTNSTVTACTKHAAFVGNNSAAITMKDCAVTNCTITGEYNYAPILGFCKAGVTVTATGGLTLANNRMIFQEMDNEFASYIDAAGNEDMTDPAFAVYQGSSLWATGSDYYVVHDGESTQYVGGTDYTLHRKAVTTADAFEARVGNTYYNTLEEAITAAPTGGTVTLVSDVTKDITIPVGANVTINGAGNTLTGKITASTSESTNVTTNLTLKNLTLKGTGSGSEEIAVRSMKQDTTTSKLNLTVEDCTIQTYGRKGIYLTNVQNLAVNNTVFNDSAKGTDGDYALDVNLCGIQGAVISITNCTFKNDCGGNGPIKIAQREGTDDTNTDISMNSAATIRSLTISGCDFTGVTDNTPDVVIGSSPNGDGTARLTCRAYPATITAKGDTVVWLRGAGTKPNDGFKLTLVDGSTMTTSGAASNNIITGGSFTADPTAYVPSGYYVSGAGPYTVNRVALPPDTTPSTTPSTTTSTTPETRTTPETQPETTPSTGIGTTPVEEAVAGTVSASADATVTTQVDETTGTVTETIQTADGAKAEVVTTAEGTVAATVEVPAETVAAAVEAGTTVTLPVTVTASSNTAVAPVVTVTLPAEAPAAKVEVPVADVAAGIVLVKVNEDGTEEIVKDAVLTENGLAVDVTGSATFKVVDNTKTFEDTTIFDPWAGDAITFVTSRELFNGTGDAAFAPAQSMTKAMLVTVLHRLENEPEGRGSLGDFADADAAPDWAADSLAWGVENGLVNGDGTALNANAPLSRQELGVILYRLAGSPTVSDETDLSAFADGDAVADWATDAMRWALEAGIITGRDDGTVDATNSANRAEVAVMLMRFVQALK